MEQPVRNAATKAIELDAVSAEAYTSLAQVKKLYDWDWAGSEQDYRRAIALGDKDEAFRLLFKAVEERSVLPFFKEDPSLDSLRSDPRWKELLRRMNFPEEQPGR